MKDFHCRDAGMDCDYVAKGQTDDEILKKAGEHAQKVHHLDLGGDMTKKVTSLIHDESSEAHRRSASQRSQHA
jgi:predicted small metal-binding protein